MSLSVDNILVTLVTIWGDCFSLTQTPQNLGFFEFENGVLAHRIDYAAILLPFLGEINSTHCSGFLL